MDGVCGRALQGFREGEWWADEGGRRGGRRFGEWGRSGRWGW